MNRTYDAPAAAGLGTLAAMEVQQVTAAELAELLRAAAQAHHEYETELGRPDEDWPTWYAEWILARLGAGAEGGG